MELSSVSKMRETVRVGVRRRLGIDTRALAAFRVALGLVVLVNLAARTRDLRAFYTGDGAVPLSAVQGYTTLSRYSLYALSDSFAFVGFLFAVTAVFAVALVIGYRTRLASVGVFLPLGARWSVDASRSAEDSAERVTASPQWRC